MLQYDNVDMGKRLNFILMADIINSRVTDQQQLMLDFRSVITEINTEVKDNFLSPMTITLGDEFQSIVTNLSSGIDTIIRLEEAIFSRQINFKLRYVLVEGIIETPINSKIAYEMLGEGLIEAREGLQNMKSSKSRYMVKLKNERLEGAINNTFTALQGIVDDWKVESDYQIVSKFIENKDYKEVAIEVNREKSVIWKRKISLKVKEYLSLKKVLAYLV